MFSFAICSVVACGDEESTGRDVGTDTIKKDVGTDTAIDTGADAAECSATKMALIEAKLLAACEKAVDEGCSQKVAGVDTKDQCVGVAKNQSVVDKPACCDLRVTQATCIADAADVCTSAEIKILMANAAKRQKTLMLASYKADF